MRPLVIFAVLALLIAVKPNAADALGRTPRGYVPMQAIRSAKPAGLMDQNKIISMAIVLPLRDQAGLHDLLGHLYNRKDPAYGHYLKPSEFTARFGPAQSDYDAVIQYARAQGFSIAKTYANRTILDIKATSHQVEAAFGLHLNNYKAADGRTFYAPDSSPKIAPEIAGKISGIVGLDTANVRKSHNRHAAPSSFPAPIGTGPFGGLAPSDISTVYNLNGASQNGSGETLGLFELDGYTPVDITIYEANFGLPAVPIQNILMDGFDGTPSGFGDVEVTLDIQLQAALAPGANKIMVYEGPNTDVGALDTYNQIALDDEAMEISTSWGLPEEFMTDTDNFAEYFTFLEMALQGQSIYAAAGDGSAYDDGQALSVDDPAVQPFMTGVGGTRLSVNPDETWAAETTWNEGTLFGGGGGGISSIWPAPDYQLGVGASATMRNVPDVSLNADQFTGYAVYYSDPVGIFSGPGWYGFGGTSCAAPLWAAFTARVNQARIANGQSRLGFANYALYQIGNSGAGALDFHDIADNSDNLHYFATPGYDNATGWGSFNGLNLLGQLAGASDFTVSASPAAVNVDQGSSAVTSITVTPFDGFGGLVTLSASGLPAGVTASFDTNPTATGGNLTLTAGISAVPGPSTITITGTSGSLTHSATVALNVTVPAEFTLSASPPTATISRGGSGASIISITPSGGFSGNVAFTAAGLPDGVTAAFAPNPSADKSVITLSASATAALGPATVIVTATSGGLLHTLNIDLNVTAQPDFTLSAAPTGVAIQQGTSGGSTLTVTPLNGFADGVSLTASGLPDGVTASFGANPATGSTSMILTASSAALPGLSVVTVTGTSNGLTHTAVVALNIIAHSVLTTIAITPGSVSVNGGGTQQFTAIAKDQYGAAIVPQPSFTWTVSGGGSINASGLFTAGGTADGNYVVTAASGAASGIAFVAVNVAADNDLNGDGKADLVLQNSDTNKVGFWYMNNAALVSGQYTSVTPAAGWKVVGEGNFNNDGRPDLVLQDTASKKIALWYMSGAAVMSGQYLSQDPSADLSVAGVGDFNGDGNSDIVLQSAGTRQITIWYMNGPTVMSTQVLSQTPAAGLAVAAARDINGDGKTDLILQNAANNQVSIWYMSGATYVGSAVLSFTPAADWGVAGAADFNKDGKADLVFQNRTTGQIAIWHMNNAALLGMTNVSTTPPAGWKVVGPK